MWASARPVSTTCAFSHLTPENAADVIAYARAYQANATGEVSEDDTPAAMRGKMTVHTPPIG